jgi:hypothetical protein
MQLLLLVEVAAVLILTLQQKLAVQAVVLLDTIQALLM